MTDGTADLIKVGPVAALPLREKEMQIGARAQHIHFDLQCGAKRVARSRCAAANHQGLVGSIRGWPWTDLSRLRHLLHAGVPQSSPLLLWRKVAR